MRKRVMFPALLASVLGVVVGCADGGRSIVGPNRVDAPAALLEGATSSITSLLIAPLNRTTALPSDVVWSFTVGTGGGSSTNTATGLTIRVPSGALSAPTTITVRALAGKPVAYAFEPHGLVFNKQAYLTQDLRGTEVDVLSSLPLLRGAHFATDELVLNEEGLAVVTEIVPALVNLLSRSVTFGIGHFSGWIIATGRSSEE